MRKPSRNLLIVVAVLAAAIAFAAYEVRQRALYLSEEDARIRADMVTVSSRVAGWITLRPVTEGQAVEAGAVLVTIDQRDAEQALVELAAQRDAVLADKTRLAADTDLARAQTGTRLQSANAELESARVTVSSLEPQLKLAQNDFARARRLFEQKMASQAARDQSETQLQRTEREYRMAKAQLQSAEAKVQEAAAERARLEVLAAQMTVLDLRAAEFDARIRRQRLDLEDRTVKSPLKGVIDRTFVEPGEYVGPGQRLLLMHDPAVVWVEVNVKETQLRRLALGQKVRVHVDAYPDDDFEGAIERIGNAATSTFALLPTPNPSGNFTKITQRVPVRIAIAQREGRLRPGMMVEVKIATGG
ncbi:MAG: HlyD family secretion protein [Betaproteobacteria bacterium]|nr:HlyD family secretion protein [Betaproteobacteria bacterium]